MIDQAPMTVEQFVERKLDAAHCEQWVELIAGKLVVLEPPDAMHGTALLNLSKAIAAALQKLRRGYACFDLGLVVSRCPDTVLFPAVSLFIEGERFAETDKTVTETQPALVIEISSTKERRVNIDGRVSTYFDWGVPHVWVIDTVEKEVRCYRRDAEPVVLTDKDVLRGGELLPEFRLGVRELFREPEWWTRP